MPYETNSAFAEHFTETGKDSPPRHLGTRYDETGLFLPEPGNTVVCHVVPDSPTASALLRVRAGLMALPYSYRFAYTPPSSYHMTVFQGIIDSRRKAGYWPDGISLDASVQETTQLFLSRLADLQPTPPFRMRIKEVTPVGVTVVGATAEDEAAIQALHDALVVPFAYRHPDHDGYTFHITLAYVKAWLPADATSTYLPALSELTRAFAAENDVIEIGPPAFCEFTDMTEFRPLRFIDQLPKAV
jgi:hypothetical protein